MFGTALAALMTGFLIGSAARYALPGPDPMPFWLTVLIGLMGSATGTAISALILGRTHTFDSSGHAFVTLLLAVGFATALVAAYRILVQKRPIIGPEAHRFPRRGLGIARMRRHLDQLGIDPDKLSRGVRAARKPSGQLSQDDVVDKLERLREQRDSGKLTEEEYEAARDQLRRY
jgi:uncharacterized membrane protein YeaQ/YmgE (transglycosylase-associated protein family)